jgi:hypothetical protein
MMQHIHYGDWTIKWGEQEPDGFKVWISTTLLIPGGKHLELYSLFLEYFESPEMGIYRGKRIIDLIVVDQRQLIEHVAHDYLSSLKPPIPVQETGVVEMENSDEIPF